VLKASLSLSLSLFLSFKDLFVFFYFQGKLSPLLKDNPSLHAGVAVVQSSKKTQDNRMTNDPMMTSAKFSLHSPSL
jgi:hypothetical protein